MQFIKIVGSNIWINMQLDEAKKLLKEHGFVLENMTVQKINEHKNGHPLKSEHFVKYFKKLLALWGFTERKKNTDPKPMTYLYTSGQNASMFEISEKGEYDDEIIVNVLNSSIAADGAVYTIVANDISYNGDNIEEFKEDLDIVFGIR